MSTALGANPEFRSNFTQDNFGGNFLFHRDTLDGDQSYRELVQDLGVETVRFPGGSVTEEYFDISNPNSSSGIDPENGEPVNLIPLNDWLTTAGELGISTTVVIPTRTYLSEATDENGDREPDFEHEELYGFVRDVVRGVHGNGEIAAFEIGNEYWGSGQMSSVEYGRLSSEMSSVIDQALSDSQDMGFDTGDIDVVVQAGTNFDFARLDSSYDDLDTPEAVLSALSEEYSQDFSEGFTFSSGEINWSKINNALIMNEFDDQEIDQIDGVSSHIYTRGELNPEMRDFSTRLVESTWLERNEDLDTYVTEWNLKSTPSLDPDTDYGLRQAHEMLEILEQFPEHGVDTAHAWPLLQNTRNALSSGFEHDELTVGGEMFRMMEESLPGNRSIDLVGSENSETEYSSPTIDVHAFGNPDELVLFLTSKSEEVTSNDFDLSGLLSGGENISVTYLGVDEGDSPGSRNANANVEEATSEEIENEIFNNGILHADLDSLEVMRVVVSQPTWTEEMEVYWEAVGIVEDEVGEIDGVYDAEALIESLTSGPGDVPPVDEPSPEPDEDFDDDGGLGIAAIALGLLPLLALLL
ncbi:type I secretion protein [Tritonibacter scottomollicae]|uniref:Type I secretion protein n=1 Tax=Tritonibacter scottomollicae TaxID=483013 RepID=A0ABZ0HJX1_TRISK|nr:type I secretion protein [Tritonibacter scottomollicae]WOI33812.1 type I secretion protein [Tritonibacter scottomollicae]